MQHWSFLSEFSSSSTLRKTNSLPLKHGLFSEDILVLDSFSIRICLEECLRNFWMSSFEHHVLIQFPLALKVSSKSGFHNPKLPALKDKSSTTWSVTSHTMPVLKSWNKPDHWFTEVYMACLKPCYVLDSLWLLELGDPQQLLHCWWKTSGEEKVIDKICIWT